MSKFSRRLDQDIISKLKAEPLFSDCLLPDIEKGHVFPAVRNNRVHFYYGGSRLFEYTTSGFRTHVKFASVLIGKRSGYIDESQLNDMKPISRFMDGYEAIKETCKNYAGDEARGISSIISKPGSHARPTTGRWIIPLDVEACFSESNDDEDDNVDRIDIVFLNADAGKLRFCEAKCYGNRELWSKPGTRPRVTTQLDEYSNNQINKRGDEIVQAYAAHVQALKALFGWHLPEPVSIDDEVPLFLLVFGFDSDQRDGRLKELLLQDGSLNGYYSYECGDPASMVLENMWTRVKRR